MQTQAAQNAQYKKMTETPVPKLVVALGIPTTISMLVTNIYNMADTYFVGQIGTSASGAIGIVFGLMAIIQAFGFMFGHGAGSVLSRLLGAKQVEAASKFASTSFAGSLIAGGLITVFGLTFLDPFCRLMGSTETILPYARIYTSFILLAAPFMCSSCVLNNILRYEGRASLAMIGLASGGFLNIFGDWLLMQVFGLGVMGAGMSTAISQLVSFGLLLSMFLRGRTQSKLSIRFITHDINDLLLILRTGLPNLMRQGLGSFSTIILNSCAGMYGDAAVAAMSIVNRICMFAFSVALGIGQGFQPVSAFNFGAKKYSRVRQAFVFTAVAGEFLLGALALLAFPFSGRLIAVFRNDPAVIAIGIPALRAQLLAMFFQPLAVCANMLFQSIGHNRSATLLASLRSGLFFIPVILGMVAAVGLPGVEYSQAVADVLTFFVSVPFVFVFFRRMAGIADGTDLSELS